ncbi:MAG TPA: hypothetical protein VGJ66_00735 [Pyrinomonadaceae bacterium]
MQNRNCARLLAALCALLTYALVGWGQQNRGMSAEDVLKRTAAVYANAGSYQDRGEIFMVQDGGSDSRPEALLRFETYFARPQLFRLEWEHQERGGRSNEKDVLWSDGEQTRWRSERGIKQVKDLVTGLVGATGVSRGAAHTVPSLLVDMGHSFRTSGLSGLALLRREDFEGTDCYVIRGYIREHPVAAMREKPVDLWIASGSYLIRKVAKEMGNGELQVEIRRDIQLNKKIPAEKFTYTPPQKGE